MLRFDLPFTHVTSGICGHATVENPTIPTGKKCDVLGYSITSALTR
jgi:hypothetical protein